MESMDLKTMVENPLFSLGIDNDERGLSGLYLDRYPWLKCMTKNVETLLASETARLVRIALESGPTEEEEEEDEEEDEQVFSEEKLVDRQHSSSRPVERELVDDRDFPWIDDPHRSQTTTVQQHQYYPAHAQVPSQQQYVIPQDFSGHTYGGAGGYPNPSVMWSSPQRY